MTTKRCSKCHESKARSEFSEDRTATDGLQGWCKVCKRDARHRSVDYIRARDAKYYQQNRDRIIKRQSEYYRKSRGRVSEPQAVNLVQIEAQLRRALRKLSAADLLRVAGAEYVRRSREPQKLPYKDKALWVMVMCILDDAIRDRADKDRAVKRALEAPSCRESVALVVGMSEFWGKAQGVSA